MTRNTYTGNGVSTDFTFSFPYLSQSHVLATINGVATTAFTFFSSSTLRFTTAPANGAAVVIYRSTPNSALLADFTAGSAIREQDLELDLQQNLYASQELKTFVEQQSTAGLQEQITTATNTANTALTVANANTTFTQSGTGAVSRSVTSKLKDTVSVKDYGATGDGVSDDTTAIRNCIAANQGKRIYLPPGRYRYAGTNAAAHYLTTGTVVVGAGRDTTVIVATTAGVGSLFYCQGYGSGVESMRFEAEVTQTTGAYVYLGGPESYIQDFFMTGDYRGVIMTGSVSQIRHGRFQDAASGGIRIDCGGGDNSQTISNVLMGAQAPANIAAAGIRLRNCTALTIHNVSVIQQGTGLLIDPTTAGEPVLSLFASQCFFDNCTNPIKITPSGGAAANRLYFTDVWCSSGTDGVLIAGVGTGTVKGIHFYNLQANLNSGSGITTGANVSNLSFDGGNVSGNSYGFYFNNAINELNISGMHIGQYDDFSGNTNQAIAFAASGFTGVRISDNSLQGNGSAIFGIANLGANCKVVNNKGYNPVGASVVTVTASPFTYTAGPSPETVYITGGTVSVIETGGQGMFSTSEKTIELGPKESLTITYTVAPTVRKSIH